MHPRLPRTTVGCWIVGLRVGQAPSSSEVSLSSHRDMFLHCFPPANLVARSIAPSSYCVLIYLLVLPAPRLGVSVRKPGRAALGSIVPGSSATLSSQIPSPSPKLKSQSSKPPASEQAVGDTLPLERRSTKLRALIVGEAWSINLYQTCTWPGPSPSLKASPPRSLPLSGHRQKSHVPRHLGRRGFVVDSRWHPSTSGSQAVAKSSLPTLMKMLQIGCLSRPKELLTRDGAVNLEMGQWQLHQFGREVGH